MTLTVQNTAIAAVISGALAFAPNTASAFPTLIQKNDDRKPTDSEALAQIQKDMKRLTELLDGRRDETGARLPSDPGLVADIKRLKDRVEELDRRLTTMQQSSTSLRPGAAPAVAARAGTVRVVNEYAVEISIILNEKSYRVAANTKLDIPVTAGEFTYQLLQAGAAATRSTIKDQEVVTLRIK